jgi:small subunit ribosomal protein S7
MTKFLNKLMKSGKKSLIETIVFNAFNAIKKKSKSSSFYLFLEILLKFRPLLGFISKRFGKQFKKIPVPLYPRRQAIVSLK